MNNTLTNDLDLLGRHDEIELDEFGELDADGAGWTTPACWAVVVGITAAICPTSTCTSECHRRRR